MKDFFAQLENNRSGKRWHYYSHASVLELSDPLFKQTIDQLCDTYSMVLSDCQTVWVPKIEIYNSIDMEGNDIKFLDPMYKALATYERARVNFTNHNSIGDLAKFFKENQEEGWLWKSANLIIQPKDSLFTTSYSEVMGMGAQVHIYLKPSNQSGRLLEEAIKLAGEKVNRPYQNEYIHKRVRINYHYPYKEILPLITEEAKKYHDPVKLLIDDKLYDGKQLKTEEITQKVDHIDVLFKKGKQNPQPIWDELKSIILTGQKKPTMLPLDKINLLKGKKEIPSK